MLRRPVPVHVVDAFSPIPFQGNPAGVVILDAVHDQPPESWLQAVAAEMRHAETAYITRRSAEGPAWQFDLRWFTPTAEVDLCGHATLASAHVVWEQWPSASAELHFYTRSGVLICRRVGTRIEMDFPALPVEPSVTPPGLLKALGLSTSEAVFVGRSKFDMLVEVKSESLVRELRPNLHHLEEFDMRGVIVATVGRKGYDVVSRFFAPRVGVPEDPVTGSAHCALAPHFSSKLGKSTLVCYQASQRSGIVNTRLEGTGESARVVLGGEAVTVLNGMLTGWK